VGTKAARRQVDTTEYGHVQLAPLTLRLLMPMPRRAHWLRKRGQLARASTRWCPTSAGQATRGTGREHEERRPTMTSPAQVQFLSPAVLPAPAGFSQVAKVTGGQTIYLSGQVPLDAAGEVVGRGDFRAQAQQVFENIDSALAAAGAKFGQVVKLTMYVTDRSYLPTLREVRDQYVNTVAPPASTLVVVQGLVREEFLLEVEAIASVPV
jgi:enamine deaminase RidA (YjgF/YER057c/UK114 family)